MSFRLNGGRTMLTTAGSMLLLAGSISAQPAQPPRRLPAASQPPIVTQHSKFNIPFTVESAQPAATVELYVSQDQGKSWRVYGRQPASAQRFQFQTELGGEYWFASRLATPGSAADFGDRTPELRVLIDFDEPQFDFESKLGVAGQIVSTWRVSDATLDPASLKIEYQADPRQPWRSVPIDRKQSRASESSLVGKVTWRPEAAQQALQVRAEVADRAGNRAVMTRVVVLPAADAEPTSGSVATVPEDPFRRAQDFANRGIAWPANNRLPQRDPAAPQDHGREQFVAQTAVPEPTQRVSERDFGASPRPPDLLGAGTAPVTSPIGQQPVADPGHRSLRASGLPGGDEPRMIRTRHFQLDYTVESTGHSSVLKVELWGTSDAGETWSVWKLDEDRASPVDVAVEQDGIYGFQVVVVAENGLAGAAPRNGDPAELWVGVDTQAPQVQLDSAAYGNGEHFGQLDIRWTATDGWLSEKPISLFFSDKPSGPWTTISPGLVNSGHHFWTVDPRVPSEIFLKIEARDDAGNVGTYQVEKPISTGGLTPRAHIDGIRPLDR